MKSQIRGVILEGLSHSGKTSTLCALKQTQAYRENSERSVFILGEHYSQQLQRIDNQLVSLTFNEHADLLDDRVKALEKLDEWATYLGTGNRRSRGLFFVLERFHLNHRFAFGSSVKIQEIEKRLSAIGGMCFLLTVSSGAIKERILSRNSKDIDRCSIDEICTDWLEAQERLVELSKESLLPITVVETDGLEWSSYAAQIMDTMN